MCRAEAVGPRGVADYERVAGDGRDRAQLSEADRNLRPRSARGPSQHSVRCNEAANDFGAAVVAEFVGLRTAVALLFELLLGFRGSGARLKASGPKQEAQCDRFQHRVEFSHAPGPMRPNHYLCRSCARCRIRRSLPTPKAQAKSAPVKGFEGELGLTPTPGNQPGSPPNPPGPPAEPVRSPRSISDLSRSVRKFPTGPQGTIGRTIREGYSAERCTVRRGGDGDANVSKVPVDDGIWAIYFNTVLLTQLDERDYIIRG